MSRSLQVTVLLLGPLPGLVLALALQWTQAPEPSSILSDVIVWLTIVNAFNLLPIKPLDGGRVVNLLFFARSANLAAAFHFVAGLALMALAWFSTSVVLALLALLMLLTVRSTHADATVAAWVQGQDLQLPDEIERLDDGQRREVFGLTQRWTRGQGTPETLASHFRTLYGHAVAMTPTIPTAILYTGLYAAGFAIAALVGWHALGMQGEPYEIIEANDRGFKARLESRYSDALAEYNKALALREAHAAKNPAQAEARYRVFFSYDDLGAVIEAMGDRARALEHLLKSLAIREQLAREEPSAARWQAAVADSHRKSRRSLHA